MLLIRLLVHFEMNCSEFDIGQGAEAIVAVARLEEGSNELIALKIAKSEDFYKNLKKEAEILSLFDHPNIISLKRSFCIEGEEQARASIGLELSREGSIFEYIFATKQGIPKRIAKYFLLQLIDGLSEIHENHIVHQDLKLENFLLFNNGKTIKIADFGMFADLNPVLEKKISQEHPKSRVNGTYTYMAPECHSGAKSFSSDIFSLMVSAFVMVHGFIPFASAMVTDKMYRLIVMKNDAEYSKAIKKLAGTVDPLFMDLFVKGVQFKPEQRIQLEELVVHPWLTEEVGTASEAESYIQLHYKTVRGQFISKIADL